MADPPPASSLALTLASMERVLSKSADPVASLAGLADPPTLATLFPVLLGAILKRGPAVSLQENLTPARLLTIAGQASLKGVVPLSTPITLRGRLQDLEAEIRCTGAWHPTEPLWWHPLPALLPSEALWSRWQREPHTLLTPPTRGSLGHAFGGHAGASLYLQQPHMLPVSVVRQLYSEVVAAYRFGSLILERGGVGSAGATSVHRWDEISFLSGTEAELMGDAPTLAAFIQWCLGPWSEELSEVMPDRIVFSPQKVMLARYPAPCGGYAAHLDNPGGRLDNGRALTLVLYLNPPDKACQGGDLLIWPPGAGEGDEAVYVVSADGGSAILFDSRAVAHQVSPVREGHDRWALTFWFNDSPTRPPTLHPAPRLTPDDILVPVDEPPLAPGVVLFHELDEGRASGHISVLRSGPPWPSVGLVSTVFQGGARLDAWCHHHFSLGFEHIILVFDHLEDPQEAEDAARLASSYPPAQMSIWSGEQLLREGWSTVPRAREPDDLRRLACYEGASFAVAARQSLNASTALAAAREGTLAGAKLEWLLHLDLDEWFFLQGPGRGGATLGDHFSAAAAAGLLQLRYVNHELLLPLGPDAALRFKVNPLLAIARLGPCGWSSLVELLSMAQTDARPYFRGYTNGKSAVRISSGAMAAGVHGWSLGKPASDSHQTFLAGPSILHFHFASVEDFRSKYMAMADVDAPESVRPFDPSPVEVEAVKLIRSLRADGAGPDVVSEHLGRLYRRVTTFTPADIELLEAAGVIMTPELDHGPQVE